MTYTVYFSIFGKQMKATVEACSIADAQRRATDALVEKIVFHNVEEQPRKDMFDIVRELNELGINVKKRR